MQRSWRERGNLHGKTHIHMQERFHSEKCTLDPWENKCPGSTGCTDLPCPLGRNSGSATCGRRGLPRRTCFTWLVPGVLNMLCRGKRGSGMGGGRL